MVSRAVIEPPRAPGRSRAQGAPSRPAPRSSRGARADSGDSRRLIDPPGTSQDRRAVRVTNEQHPVMVGDQAFDALFCGRARNQKTWSMRKASRYPSRRILSRHGHSHRVGPDGGAFGPAGRRPAEGGYHRREVARPSARLYACNEDLRSQTHRSRAQLAGRRRHRSDARPACHPDRRRAPRQAQADVHAAHRHRRLRHRGQCREDLRDRQQARRQALLPPLRAIPAA